MDYRTKVILTDSVCAEDPFIERPRLRNRLKELFQAACIFITKEPFADDMVPRCC